VTERLQPRTAIIAAKAVTAKLKISVLIAYDLFALALVFFETGIGFINTVLEFRLGVFQAAGPAPCFQSLVVLLFGARRQSKQ